MTIERKSPNSKEVLLHEICLLPAQLKKGFLLEINPRV